MMLSLKHVACIVNNKFMLGIWVFGFHTKLDVVKLKISRIFQLIIYVYFLFY